MIKRWVMKVFPAILDVSLVLGLLGTVGGAVFTGMHGPKGGGFAFVPFGMTLFLGLAWVLTLFGSLYLMLDVRDTLRDMAHRNRNGENTES